ncbi:hypothetical protein NCC78_26350 [Micromonospora phytophila]|uniref:hypothetical protein n=1 Tax=Micromonospora phytophila TaxID=709888 RepID=UPI0020307497|nr:hypothetical protein [Micromonospora phytophila]MCM0678170.1 hypothetical protein [Micromonospora phytophila]
MVVAAVHHNGQVDRVIERVPYADPVEVSIERRVNLLMALLSGVPALLLAGWLAATAFRLRRGSNTARILVFVAACGQVLLCPALGCFGALLVRTQLAADPGTGGSSYPTFDLAGGEQSEFDMMIEVQSPTLDLVFGMVSLGLLLVPVISAVVVVLLRRPDAAGWFSRRAAAVHARSAAGSR